MVASLKIGVIGLGRMGRLYAEALATRIEGGELYAVASLDVQERAQAASSLKVPHIFAEAGQVLALSEIDAVVIATPTSTHHDLVLAAAEAKKAIFCEKPLALTLAQTKAALDAVAHADVPLQVGFMRRFDAAYQRAQAMIAAGQIGEPVTFKAVSRDPFCPPCNYMDPAQNGGLILDMAIHDFDMARWLMRSEVVQVATEGALLVCKDLAAVGDIDNALINLRFASGALGNVEVSRNAFYGYDIRTEVLGSEGALMIGSQQHTPVVLLTRAGAQQDTIPYLMERFGEAYHTQLQHFVTSLQQGQAPSVGGAEALAACEIGVAATLAYQKGQPVKLADLRASE
ncbi:MAG TPA: inositol 2-dehydrogenase [Ktedonobacteraceae bacterium]|nr:inositol 2-dehydrogenase [Ktedonobacteraceae bacterium]